MPKSIYLKKKKSHKSKLKTEMGWGSLYLNCNAEFKDLAA